jgi:hypothetical protein
VKSRRHINDAAFLPEIGVVFFPGDRPNLTAILASQMHGEAVARTRRVLKVAVGYDTRIFAPGICELPHAASSTARHSIPLIKRRNPANTSVTHFPPRSRCNNA